jgi:hypothetical protein
LVEGRAEVEGFGNVVVLEQLLGGLGVDELVVGQVLDGVDAEDAIVGQEVDFERAL